MTLRKRIARQRAASAKQTHNDGAGLGGGEMALPSTNLRGIFGWIEKTNPLNFPRKTGVNRI